jgi:hypothetical protein
MQIFAISKNRFAIGNLNKRAEYVVEQRGKNFVGVRGQRPVLESGRFKAVKANASLKGVFAEALK